MYSHEVAMAPPTDQPIINQFAEDSDEEEGDNMQQFARESNLDME